MHLKTLTLKGFKSFASATTLRFEPGITCVVGPNGSGKSNVVDALAWVMGEQGVKALRGGKMQDVIFAGTAGRGPLGRAEVTLTIDNSDGALPIDYSEVSITRRMFRDGAGEYEINGNSCRLMDVQELLSDSGIGREMHVIVGQGQLSAILESRPEDRRVFIEEAAGVLKHRKRKEKAVRKLDAMQANMARLTDLTTELRRQLKPLGRQAEAARRAATVQAELRDARLRLAADDLVTRREELASQQSRQALAREQQIVVQAELDAARAALAQREFELARLTPAADAAAQTCFRVSALTQRLAATVQIATDRTRHLSAAAPAMTGRDPDQLAADAQRAAAEEAELAAGVQTAAAALESAREQLSEHEQHADAAEQAHVAALRAGAQRREDAARIFGQLEALRNQAAAGESEVARLAEELAQVQQRAAQAAEEFQAGQAQLAELEAAEEALDADYEQAVTAFEQAQRQVEQLREADRSAGTQVASLTARIEALGVGAARGDGGAWLLDRKDCELLGRLTEKLTVTAGFEAAVAAALGPLAEAVVAGTAESAGAAVQALKRAQQGQAAVIHREGAGRHQDPPVAPSGATRLSQVVQCPPELCAALAAVTATTLVADDVAAATALVRAHPQWQVVTREGDLVGDGWLFGGGGHAASGLQIQAEIAAARDELATWQQQTQQAAETLSAALAEQAQCKDMLDVALLQLHESDQAFVACHDRIARLGQAARQATSDGQRLHKRHEQARTTAAGHQARLAECEQRLDAAQSDESDEVADSAAEAAAQRRESAAAALGEARSLEVEARLAMRTAEERAEAMRGRAESLRRAAAAALQARARAQHVQEGRRRAAEVCRAVTDCGHAVATELATVLDRAAARRDALQRRRTEATAAVSELQRQAETRATRAAELTDAVHRDEVARAEAALRIEALEATIAEQFAIAVDELIAEYGPEVRMPPTALETHEYEQARARGEEVSAPQPMRYDRQTQQRRAQRAERELSTLGTVNPLALEEFAALEERYTFLATQLEDVRKARQDLLDVVAEVDERILGLFASAYEDVAREFGDVFAVLFPGGEGRLLLTDPDEMLTTGVEVEARPPGKKVKRLSLLSGGEKSLTAVALLVAIFRARPSPFYVMDEVEAALDDTNLRRLIGLFEQLRHKSQLIVITHQKPTMEVADVLYGVSMRNDGITQVISQRLRTESVNVPAS